MKHLVFALVLEFTNLMLSSNSTTSAPAPPETLPVAPQKILIASGESQSAFRQALARTRQTASIERTEDHIIFSVRPLSIVEFEKELTASGLQNCPHAQKILRTLKRDVKEHIHIIHSNQPIGDHFNYARNFT